MTERAVVKLSPLPGGEVLQGRRVGCREGIACWYTLTVLLCGALPWPQLVPAPAWSWHQKARPHLVSSPDPGSEGGQTQHFKHLRSLPRRFLGPEASGSSGSLPLGPRGISILGLAQTEMAPGLITWPDGQNHQE